MASKVQARRILLSIACVLFGFAILVTALPMRAELAETNYQANLIRLQAFSFGARPKAVLVGSSISGRMLSRYFEGTSLWPLSNLGIDGTGPEFGLNLVSDRPPPLVIVETNRLCKPPGPNEAMLREAMHGPLYRAASRIPLLRAECRPSSMLYTWVKMSREALIPVVRGNTSTVVQKTQSDVPLAPAQLPPEFEAMTNRIRAALRELRGKGSQVVIVRMPTESRTAIDVATFQFATELAQELMIPEIDLESECRSRGYNLAFTDGTHMTPTSANESSQLLAELVEKQLSTMGFEL